MNCGTQGLGNVVSLVLAAILGPKEFGTVTIALIFLAFIQLLLEQGLEDALVQRHRLEAEHLDSACWFVVSCSLVLMGVSIGASQWWAGLNHQPVVGSVLRVLSFKIPIYALTIVQRAVMVRRLEFKALAFQWNMAEVIGGVIGIGMAAAGFGLWSLVGQQLGRDLSALALLWKISGWRPQIRFSFSHIKDLFSFSIATFLAALGSYLQSQADTLVIGLFFGPTAVGLYRLADRIRLSTLTVVTKTVQWISLPKLSKLQDDPVKLRNTYLSLLRVSMAATAPVMISLAATSDLVVGVLGAKWHAAAQAISLLCLMGIFEGFTVLTTPLLQARSEPMSVARLVWVFGLVNILLTATCGYYLREASMSWQVNGVALCKLSAFVLAYFPVNMAMARRASDASARAVAHAMSSGAAAAFASLLLIFIVKILLMPKDLAPGLILGITLTLAFAAGTGVILWREHSWRAQLMLFIRSRLILKLRRS
jgi:PST family polysaccharide transporter